MVSEQQGLQIKMSVKNINQMNHIQCPKLITMKLEVGESGVQDNCQWHKEFKISLSLKIYVITRTYSSLLTILYMVHDENNKEEQ